MIDPKTENKLKRRDTKRKKGRYGMIVNTAGRKLAQILQGKINVRTNDKD